MCIISLDDYLHSNVFRLPSVFKDVAEFNWDTQLQGNVFVLFVFFVSFTEFVPAI